MQGTDASNGRTDESIRISFKLPSSLHSRFRDVAKAEHRTVSAELRRLMEQRIAEVQDEAKVTA